MEIMQHFVIGHNRLQSRNIYTVTLIVLVALGIAHITLGSNPVVPALAILTMVLAMWPMIRYGPLNIATLFILLVAFRYVGFPLFAKFYMGQALDTYLEQPVTAFAAVFLGVAAYVCAFILANNIPIGKPILKPLTDPYQLRHLSLAFFIIGFFANLDASLNAYIESDELTISNFFTPVLHLALISGIAATLLRSDSRRPINLWVFIILMMEIYFAFALNSRTPIIEAFLCLIITVAAFKGRVSIRQIIGGIAVLLLLLAIITPVALSVRTTRTNSTIDERISNSLKALIDWDSTHSEFIDNMEKTALSPGYFMDYYDSPGNVFERFSHVNDVDVLISGADNAGMLGFQILNHAFDRALPRVLNPDKPHDYNEGDWIFCEFGIKCNYGNFLTASLIGVSYAGFGWAGVIFFPFILGLSLLLLIKKAVGFNVTGNVWGIYFLVTYNNHFVEGGMADYIAVLLRNIPQDLVIMLVLINFVVVTRTMLGKSR